MLEADSSSGKTVGDRATAWHPKKETPESETNMLTFLIEREITTPGRHRNSPPVKRWVKIGKLRGSAGSEVINKAQNLFNKQPVRLRITGIQFNA